LKAARIGTAKMIPTIPHSISLYDALTVASS
jgi:hypothetical protein